MNTDRMFDGQAELEQRASLHAALSELARLRIVDALAVGDAAPSELAAMLDIPSNLLAHHLRILESARLITRTRSEGDKRRSYLRLVPATLDALTPPPLRSAERVLFVCTANSTRSQLAAALWRHVSPLPAVSAGTHPAERIHPGAIAAAERHRLPLRRVRPRAIADVQADNDLVITVCDVAHEELRERADLHWSVADPVRVGTAAAFDRAHDELARRVNDLAPRLRPAS